MERLSVLYYRTINMFFGAYGNDGIVTMEVDYVHYYQWETESDNELPNGNFEYNGNRSVYLDDVKMLKIQ